MGSLKDVIELAHLSLYTIESPPKETPPIYFASGQPTCEGLQHDLFVATKLVIQSTHN